MKFVEFAVARESKNLVEKYNLDPLFLASIVFQQLFEDGVENIREVSEEFYRYCEDNNYGQTGQQWGQGVGQFARNIANFGQGVSQGFQQAWTGQPQANQSRAQLSSHGQMLLKQLSAVMQQIGMAPRYQNILQQIDRQLRSTRF